MSNDVPEEKREQWQNFLAKAEPLLRDLLALCNANGFEALFLIEMQLERGSMLEAWSTVHMEELPAGRRPGHVHATVAALSASTELGLEVAIQALNRLLEGSVASALRQACSRGRPS